MGRIPKGGTQSVVQGDNFMIGCQSGFQQEDIFLDSGSMLCGKIPEIDSCRGWFDIAQRFLPSRH